MDCYINQVFASIPLPDHNNKIEFQGHEIFKLKLKYSDNLIRSVLGIRMTKWVLKLVQIRRHICVVFPVFSFGRDNAE